MAITLNLAAKAALLALIAVYLSRPDLEQFTGKVMPFRAALFPVAASLVLLGWLATGRRRPFPHLPDALVTLAAVVDFGGNAADLYRFEWFDHSVHLVNTFLLVTAFGLLLGRAARLQPWALGGLALGFGAVLHTIWEIVEHWLDHLLDANLDVTARTTIVDLTAGLLGSALGAALVWRQEKVSQTFGSPER